MISGAVPADAVITETPLAAPDNARADADGAPLALTTEPGAVDAGMLAGAQSQTVARETLSGFAAASCTEAVAESWLVGGATDVGRTGIVLLANPTAVAATVDVRVIGETGRVDAPSALGIIVPPGSQRVLSLAGLAPNVVSPVVHVTSTGGAIAASLEHSVIEGLDARGRRARRADGAACADTGHPRIRRADRRRHRPGRRPRRGRRLPGGAAARDRRGAGPGVDRRSSPRRAVGGSTVDVDSRTRARHRRAARRTRRGGLHDPTSRAMARSSRPPAPRRARPRSRPIPTAPTPRHPSTSRGPRRPCRSSTRRSSPCRAGPRPVLHLANPGDDEVEVRYTLGGDERSITIAGGDAASVDLDDQSIVELAGVAGVHATVTFSGDQALASFAVQPPGPLDSPIRVYPR